MPPKKSSPRALGAGSGAVTGRVVSNGHAAGDPVAAVQATVEGAAVQAETITFLGRDFRIADKVGLMPLLAFANASKAGLRTEDLDGLAAMYAMIRDCIHPGHACTCGEGFAQRHPDPGAPGQMTGGVPDRLTSLDAAHKEGCEWDPGDWAEFERHAINERAEGDDLFTLINDVIEMMTARPTTPRSGSSSPESRPSARSRVPSAFAEGLVSVEDLARSPR